MLRSRIEDWGYIVPIPHHQCLRFQYVSFWSLLSLNNIHTLVFQWTTSGFLQLQELYRLESLLVSSALISWRSTQLRESIVLLSLNFGMIPSIHLKSNTQQHPPSNQLTSSIRRTKTDYFKESLFTFRPCAKNVGLRYSQAKYNAKSKVAGIERPVEPITEKALCPIIIHCTPLLTWECT